MGNSATGDGVGIDNSGTANLSFVTIASNSNPSGSGIWNDGTVNIKNSIVGNNTVGSNYSNFGTLTASGENIDTDGSCSGFTTVTPAALNLGPLANNGGPTQTHALLSGSAAIDAVPLGQCTDLSSPPVPVTKDQRGVARPQGSNCDVGAYEAPSTLVRRVTLEQPGGGNCLYLDLQDQTYKFRTSTSALFIGSIHLMRRGSQIRFSNVRTGETWIMGGTANLTPLGRGQAVLRTFPYQIFRIDDPNLSDNTCVP